MEMRTAFCVYGNECDYADRADVHWSLGRNALVASPLRVYDAQVEFDASSRRCSACLRVLSCTIFVLVRAALTFCLDYFKFQFA